LATSVPARWLVTAAVLSIAGAVVLGIVGLFRVGPGLAVLIVAGVVLNCGYNLELFGGVLHNDVTFALAWGSFPVLTAYYTQAESVRPVALLAACAAFFMSMAQRSLSTSARHLRRRVASVEGSIVDHDGTATPISRTSLLRPIEAALKSMAWGMVTLAVALIVYRTTT
jgi:hypothetical protein